MIFDHYVMVREWTPNFNLERVTIDSIAIWVRFPKLVMEYYDKKCLRTTGNRIGKTLKIDFTTEEKTRGKYARVVCYSI